MGKSVLTDRSMAFSRDIVVLCRRLQKDGVERALVQQLLRAGTSVGANVAEAQYGQGRKDFASKLKIGLKECRETEYWLELLLNAGSIPDKDYAHFKKECIELCRMLGASVRTVEQSLK